MDIPSDIAAILAKLDKDDQDKVSKYITGLLEKLPNESPPAGGKDDDNDGDTDMKVEPDEASKPTTGAAADDDEDLPPIYQSGEDYDAAADAKQQAADCKAAGDWAGALEHYTKAVLAAPPSALLYANRATALLEMGRFTAAERDCDLALKENPDSAKALRMRGKARKALGKYDLALQDLSSSQQIDFDEGTVEDLKFLTEKRIEAEKAEAEKRNQEEEKMRKRAQEIKKAQAEAKRQAQDAKRRGAGMPGASGMGGMPGAGMPGGMPAGMPGMAEMMNDPEIMAAFQNPKVVAAFQELMSGPGGPMGLMSNPAKLQELMSDPEVGPVLKKLISKFGGGMGGGMPGFPGGMPGGPGADNDDGDDIPDMPDISEVD